MKDYFANSNYTKLGGRLCRKRAQQTIKWCQNFSGKQYIRLLEIGIGRGWIAKESEESDGFEYIGIDNNPNAIDRIKKSKYRYGIVATVPPIPEINEDFDAVVAEAVFEHMPDFKTAEYFLSECYRVLNENGVIVMRFPDFRYHSWQFFNTPDHTFITTLTRVKRMVCAAGFEIIKAGHFVDCFTGIMAHVIGLIVSLIPDIQREGTLSKITGKRPQAYIIAKKILC